MKVITKGERTRGLRLRGELAEGEELARGGKKKRSGGVGHQKKRGREY